MAGLMQQCSVLDLDAFERCNKAEGLGVSDPQSGSAGNTNLSDAEFTCKLFRFLQLLCEGHNLGKIEDAMFTLNPSQFEWSIYVC